MRRFAARCVLWALRRSGDGILFAATYPERVAALIVRSCSPRTMWAPDFPLGRSAEAYEREMNQALRVYQNRDEARKVALGLGMQGDREIEPYIDLLRWGASPGMLEALYRMNSEIDVRDVLPTVRVPTLVMHGVEDQVVPLEVGRYTARRIPAARFVEIPGVRHLALGGPRADRIQVEINRFLDEVRQTGGWEEAEPDRVLATVLFTDIVGSSTRAADLGDRPWRELLERHHSLIQPARAVSWQRGRYRRRRLLRLLRRAGASDPLRLRDCGGHARTRP